VVPACLNDVAIVLDGNLGGRRSGGGGGGSCIFVMAGAGVWVWVWLGWGVVSMGAQGLRACLQ